MNSIESSSATSMNKKEEVPSRHNNNKNNNNDNQNNNHHDHRPRGAFILLEGIDRCGKTTQSKRLLQRFIAAGISATIMNFPDRTTTTGHIIDQYLQSKQEIDDHAIHLLFSANRWENSKKIYQSLYNGTTIVCDRYAYSGVAFSSAKIKHDIGHENTNEKPEPILDIDWCKAPDRGLPAPDCILFLDIPQEEAQKRGGYVISNIV
jgi:dTMP kinase